MVACETVGPELEILGKKAEKRSERQGKNKKDIPN